LPAEGKRALVAVDPERADILTAGLAVLEAVLSAGGMETVTVSDRGLRFGTALLEFEKG